MRWILPRWRKSDACCGPSSKKWSGTAKMPMFTSLRRMERRICRPLTNLCIRWERIANEILMYFRSQKKLQGEVSLSETIESDREGNALQLMDVIGVDDTMLEDLYDRDSALRLRRLVKECLTQRESEVIRLRYGLGGTVPLTQREIASTFGISRSYVSRWN